MKHYLLISIFAILTLAGCASKNDVNEIAIPQDKIYVIIFEGNPKITDKRVMSSSNIQIGDVLIQTPSASDLTVIKVSIKEAYTQLIRTNTVFVASDGYLKYDQVGETGAPLAEGGRLLGFTGKAKLLWFKTKSKVTGLSQAAKNKAEQLYRRVTN